MTPNPAPPSAGPDLDDVILTRVLGWHHEPRFPSDTSGYWVTPDGERCISEERPAPSRDIADFFFYVVPAMRARGFSVDIDDQGGNPWWVEFRSAQEGMGVGETIPLAGCHAALAALTAPQDEV